MKEEEVQTDEPKVEEKFRLRSVIIDQDALFLREESEVVPLTTIESGANVMDKETSELAAALKTRLIEKDALGVAAIQLGVKKRMFAMRKPFSSDRIVTVINPKIDRVGPKFSVRTEGCLSIDYLPENIKGALVKRHSEIYVSYTDQDGIDHKEEMLMGMDARVFQHELDHLNGKLMIDEPAFQGWQRAY